MGNTLHRLRNLIVIPTGFFLISCQSLEEQVLDKYFDAVRSGDHVTLAGMSVVGFSGPVESWEVVEVGPESRAPFRLPELRQLEVAAKLELNEQFHEYEDFLKENRAAFNRIRDRLDEDPDYRFHGRWGEIQSEWEAFRDRHDDLDRRRQEIFQEIQEEVKLAEMSLMISEEFYGFEGEIITKDVILRIETAEGGERSYRFVLRMYDLASKAGDFKPPSRWIVTAIEEE